MAKTPKAEEFLDPQDIPAAVDEMTDESAIAPHPDADLYALVGEGMARSIAHARFLQAALS